MWGFLCCKLGGATKSGRKILYTVSTHASHIASTTMRRTPQSATMSNENIKCLYVNLHKVFRKHFRQSPENTAKLKKMLSFFLKWITFTCLHGVEPRFRILRWMQAEFCYFDSIFRHPGTANIRPEETSFLMSPKEIYLVQLIADLQPIFANKHCTKMKFSIKYFFSICDQICRKLWVWSHLLKKSLMENFIFL